MSQANSDSDTPVPSVIVTESDYSIEQHVVFDTVASAGGYATTLPVGARLFGKLFINQVDCTPSVAFDATAKALSYTPVAGDYIPDAGDPVVLSYCSEVPLTLFPKESPGLQSYKSPSTPIPQTIAAGGSWNSGVMIGGGYTKISVALTTDQNCALFVTRYVDQNGTVAEPSDPQQLALTANTPGVLNILDNIPFGSFSVRVNNTGTNPANTSNLFILLND